jgi:hypothetical protein
MSRFKLAKWTEFCVKLVAAILLVVAAMPLLYVAQTRGVCLKAGRVLDAGELRRRVLLNVIDRDIQSTIFLNEQFRGVSYQVGIASPAQETDIRKLVELAFHDDKPIEEHFGLEMLVRGRDDIPARNFDLDGVAEPFLLMGYDLKGHWGWGGALVSSDIQEIQVAGKQIVGILGYQVDWQQRLLGYGNHYFSMPRSSIKLKCCDNRDVSRPEYQEKKRRAYMETLSHLDFLAKSNAERMPAAVVSNCGGLLLTEEGDAGGTFSRRNIIQRVWIKEE